MTSAFAMVFGWLVVETWRATRNEHAQLARGGVEPAGDVYRLMRVAYPGVFLMMFIERVTARSSPPLLTWGVVVFLIAKALKWWAIITLGPFWTFRVIVLPGSSPIASGPYRWLRHPNYIAVVGEIVGVALMTDARITGPLALIAFGALLIRRVQVENRALDAILRRG